MPYYDRSYKTKRSIVPRAGYKRKTTSYMKKLRATPTRSVPYPDRGDQGPKFIARVPWGVPAEKWCRMRYCEEVVINPGAGLLAAHVFRANSCFDPNLTEVGHQPMNYDQLSSPYVHYTVYGSKITATRLRTITTPLLPGYFGIFLNANAVTGYTTGPEVIESNEKASQWLMVGGLEGGQFGEPKLTLGYSAKTFLGVKDLSGSIYRAAVGTNPTEDANFTIWVASIGGDDPGAMTICVEIEYLVKFSERSFESQS